MYMKMTLVLIQEWCLKTIIYGRYTTKKHGRLQLHQGCKSERKMKKMVGVTFIPELKSADCNI